MSVETKVRWKEVTGRGISSSIDISRLLWSRRMLSVVPSCVPCLRSAQDAMQDPWWLPSLPTWSPAPSPRKPAFPVHISWGLSCSLTTSPAHRQKGDVASQITYFPFWRNVDHGYLSMLICMVRKWAWWPLRPCPSVVCYGAIIPGCHREAKTTFVWVEFTSWHGTKFKRYNRVILPPLWSCLVLPGHRGDHPCQFFMCLQGTFQHM